MSARRMKFLEISQSEDEQKLLELVLFTGDLYFHFHACLCFRE